MNVYLSTKFQNSSIILTLTPKKPTLTMVQLFNIFEKLLITRGRKDW